MLVPAPPDVLPFIVVACVMTPIAADIRFGASRDRGGEPGERLRRELDRLPETPLPWATSSSCGTNRTVTVRPHARTCPHTGAHHVEPVPEILDDRCGQSHETKEPV